MPYLIFLPVVFLLSGCGGGGGGGAVIGSSASTPTLSTPVNTPAVIPADFATSADVTPPSTTAVTRLSDGVTVQDGTALLPFSQTTLSSASITDPNAFVSSSTDTYDLTWTGNYDPIGQDNAVAFPASTNNRIINSRLEPGRAFDIGMFGIAAFTAGDGGTPLINQPHPDVLAAWNQGFTGANIDTMLIADISPFADVDGFTSCNSDTSCRAGTTQLTWQMTSPGMVRDRFTNGVLTASGFAFVMDSGGDQGGNVDLLVRNSSGALDIGAFDGLDIDVVLFSHSADFAGSGLDPTNAADQNTMAVNLAQSLAAWDVVLANERFTSGSGTFVDFADATIVKAAGDELNRSLDVQLEPLTASLMNTASIANRTIIVGALSSNGTTGTPAGLAANTNVAGSNTTFSDRFVMANGSPPHQNGGLTINGTAITGVGGGGITESTAFAAARVAGYITLLRQKFPNLTGAQAANIILDTARTDTLACGTPFSVQFCGQGEASLSRALSPVGSLR